MKAKNPIKRSPYIRPLSRDHHQSLLLVWKIRQGIAKGIAAERISSYGSSFYEQALVHHFRQEQDYLFSKMPSEDPLTCRALSEHERLRAGFRQINNAPSYESLSRLAGELEDHIRFEERLLFPHIEQTLEVSILREISAVLDRERAGPEPPWPDTFWNGREGTKPPGAGSGSGQGPY